MIQATEVTGTEKMHAEQIDILLVYPQLGSQDGLLKDIPLSLLYAATHSVKHGYKVRFLDCRLYPYHWKQRLHDLLEQGVKLVGVSVMTGNPIRTGLEVTGQVKAFGDIPVVWGGPHPTILPEQTLAHPDIDYVIRDWGSEPLWRLISVINGDGGELVEIKGLGYKQSGQTRLNPTTCEFELLDYRDIPYHLVDIDAGKYNRMKGGEFIFPLYTAVGCPYKCAFCMSPHVYSKIKGKKWIPFPVDEVIAHIDYLQKKYNFQRLQIYDDDSFVDLNRLREFFKQYIAVGFHEKFVLDFRGARINELDRANDELLDLMDQARVEIMAIGVESGSDHALKLMNKGISVEQVRRVSKRLAQYPRFRPHYNIMCGIPGETYDDLVQTKELVLELVQDNPRCFIGAAGFWKAYPGSVMTERAEREWGLELPKTLEGWAEIDSLDTEGFEHPWYTEKNKRFIHMLQLASYVLDQKLELVEEAKPPFFSLVNLYVLLGKLYRPILKFRLRHNFTGLLLEHWFRIKMMKFLGRAEKDTA